MQTPHRKAPSSILESNIGPSGCEAGAPSSLLPVDGGTAGVTKREQSDASASSTKQRMLTIMTKEGALASHSSYSEWIFADLT